jgi:hypothetical protein
MSQLAQIDSSGQLPSFENAVPRRRVPSLEPGCPWYELSEAAPPNVKWCEENLCSYVTAPANTWSNLGYVLVGVVFWQLARNSGSKAIRGFGPAALTVGLTSGVYHASYNFYTQLLDFFGMFVFCYLLIVLNLRRMGAIAQERMTRVFWGAVLVSTGLVVVFERLSIPYQSIVLLLILAVVATEALIRRRQRRVYTLRYFYGAVGLIAAGAVCSALDVTGVWCDPKDHLIQGHAIWHLFGAGSLLSAFFHYRQFEKSI